MSRIKSEFYKRDFSTVFKGVRWQQALPPFKTQTIRKVWYLQAKAKAG